MPRAAADDPHVLQLGMAVDDEVRVGSDLVLADPRFDDGLDGQRREAPGEIRAGEARRLRVDDSLAKGWIEDRPVPIRPDLEPSPLSRRDAIEGLVIVDPRWHRLGAETDTASRQPEI